MGYRGPSHNTSARGHSGQGIHQRTFPLCSPTAAQQQRAREQQQKFASPMLLREWLREQKAQDLDQDKLKG